MFVSNLKFKDTWTKTLVVTENCTYIVQVSNMQDLEDGPHINMTKPVTEHSHADTDMTFPTELILNQLVYY